MGLSQKQFRDKHRYNYDSAGNINKFEDLANGKTYVYKYDLKNQLTHVYEQTTSGETLSSSLIYYDEKSRPEYLYYDIAYAVGSSSAVLETVYINEYNEDGNVDKYRVESGSTKYHFDPEYDSMDRVKKRTVNLIASAGTLNHTVEYGFTANGTNTSLQVSDYVSKISGVIVNQYQYVYDNNGNITQIKNGSGVIRNQYAYDDLGQLVREDNRALNKSYTYSYDNAGNITSRKTYAFTTGTLGTATNTESYTYGNASWGDLVTSISGYSITYDAVGNPLTYYTGGLDSVLTWTNGRQLASFENMDGLRTYTYNDEGIRISRTVSGVEHKYQLNGTQIVSETWGNHTIFYVYDENGSIAGMRYRTSSYAEGAFDEYLFEKDLQGDVVAIYNASGTKLISYKYDAWGNFTTTYHNGGASTTAVNNPFRYRGYYYDSDTGLYYLNSRYYDPVTGRFISADTSSILSASPMGLTDKNLFAYCDNNPVVRSDNGGEFWTIVIGAVVGAAVGAIGGAVSSIVSQAMSGEEINWTAVGISAAGGAVSGAISGAFPCMGPVLTGVIEGTISAATYAATEKIAYGRDPSLKETLQVGISSGLMAGSMQFIGQELGFIQCFIAGTIVATKAGPVPIEDIKPGDLVWATDKETGETALKEVVQLFRNETMEWVHVTVDGEKITCTPEHPFYVPQKGWTSAIDLRAGDILVMLNGEYVIVEQVQHELLESPEITYNFEVEDFHTYYVGKRSLLVHNMCKKEQIKNPSKSESGVWRGLKNSKNGLKTSGSGKNQRFYSWDNLHNEIEVFDRLGKHLGVMDPITGEMIKKAVKGRWLKL